MKRHLAIIAIAIIAIAIIATISALPCAHAKRAAKAPAAQAAAPDEVDAVEARYHALSDLTAKFVQTTNVALVERTVTKRGTFQFKKGGKLRIAYDGKGGKSYVSDGTTLWIFVPGDDASLQTFQVNDETVPKEALSFLGGFGKLKKEFEVSASASFPDAPSGTTALHLLPRGDKKHYESLDALFNSDRLLVELIVKNASGNESRYTFSDIRTDANLSDRIFTLSSGKATPDTLPQ